MKVLIVNCTLKASPDTSNAEALAKVVFDKLREEGVEVAEVRAVDENILPGSNPTWARGTSGLRSARRSSGRRSS